MGFGRNSLRKLRLSVGRKHKPQGTRGNTGAPGLNQNFLKEPPIKSSLTKRDALRVGPSAAEQDAEKLNVRPSAPKGAIDFEGLAVSLKRYPDTNPWFFRKL